MRRVAQSPRTYKRVAYHAELHGVHGQAIRDERGRVWFVNDANDQVTPMSDADMPALFLFGRVDLAAAARVADLHAGLPLRRGGERTERRPAC